MILRLFTFFVLFGLYGCVTTSHKVYLAPKVTGQIVDLQTLEPLQAMHVAHRDNLNQFVITNVQGEFSLPSISEKDFRVLLANPETEGHLVLIYNQNNQIGLMIPSTKDSASEEIFNLKTIVFDSEPKVIAQPSKPSFPYHGELKLLFSSDKALVNCDKILLNTALGALNTSRKLAEKASDKIETTQTKAQRLRSLTFESYQRTQVLWKYLKKSCQYLPEQSKRVDKMFSGIEQEASFLVF